VSSYFPGTELTAQQLSSIDSKGGVYFTLAFNLTSRHVHLIGIDLISGAITENTPLPFKDSGLVGVGGNGTSYHFSYPYEEHG